MSIPIGQRAIGTQKTFHQYHLTKELAKKYSHSTYLASPGNEPERQVVLTVFTSSLLPECETLLQKAQRIKALQHPHLMSLVDMGIEQGQPFVVRDYLPKGSLRNRLQLLSPHSLQLSEALTLVLQVGQALAAAHEHDIFHGNMKPENILFDLHDQVVVTDFSLVSDLDVIIRDHIAEEYAFHYMAPEQFLGICDARSDQYALGCFIYELIAGHVPFETQSFSLASLKEYHSNALLTPVFEDARDLPPSLKAAVLKALTKDPAKRFCDFSLFLEVIQAAMPPLPVVPLARGAHIPETSTPSRSERLDHSPLLVSELMMTTSRSDEQYLTSDSDDRRHPQNFGSYSSLIPSDETGDQAFINSLFEEAQEELSLARASASSIHESSPSAISTITSVWAQSIDGFGSGMLRGKRALVLALLVSMALALIAQAFWPLKMFPFEADVSPMTPLKNKQAHPAAMPPGTLTPTSVLPVMPPPMGVPNPNSAKPVGTASSTSHSSYPGGGYPLQGNPGGGFFGGGYPGGGGPGRGMW